MRIPAETMYDSKSQCYYQFLHYDRNSAQELKPFDTARAVRIHCDPIMYLSQVRRVCLDDPTGKYDFALYTKKTTDTAYQAVIDIQDACAQKYDLLWAELHQGGN